MTPETCGTCKFRNPIPNDLKVSECYGLPPTPIPVGMGPQGPIIGGAVPRIELTRPACSLYKLKGPSLVTG